MSRCIHISDLAAKKGKNLPILFMTGPGFGKTTTVSEYCKLHDYIDLQLIPSNMNSDDVLGFEVKTTDSLGRERIERLAPSWFNYLMDRVNNEHKRVCLFIDEITTCDPYIQGPLLNLIFSKRLGLKHQLPEDSFIIAAGNYAKNTTFEMIDAMVNRFLVVNMRLDDYDSHEQISANGEVTMKKVSATGTKEDRMNFFGLTYEKPVFNGTLFRKWLDKNFKYSDPLKSESKMVAEEGLIGFSSPRALELCMDFMEEYTQHYSDEIWSRVVGDTLGVCNTDLNKGKLMADLIHANMEDFIGEEEVIFRDFVEIAKDIKKNPGDKNLYQELKDWFDAHDTQSLTPQDTTLLLELDDLLSSRGEKAAAYLINTIKEKVMQSMAG